MQMLQQSFPFLVIMIILKFNINHKIMLFEVGTQSQWNQIKFFFKDIMLFAKTVQKT